MPPRRPLRAALLALLSLFPAAFALADQPAEPLADTARRLFQEKRFAEARTIIEKIAAAEPQNAEPRYYLGVLAQQRGDTDEAIRQFGAAVSLAPKNSGYVLELGGAYGNAAQKAGLLSKYGLAKKCLAAFQQAVALDPDNVAARRALVNYYRMAPSLVGGGIDKAYAEVAEIRKRDAPLAQTLTAQLLMTEKKYDEAIAICVALADARPDSHYAHYEIGRAVSDSGHQLDVGEKALRRCLELTPQPNSPGQAAVHWRLGLIAEKRGDPAAARKLYQAALALDPNLKPARDSLAKLK